MVKIAASELARLADLSQLKLTDDEIKNLAQDLEQVLEAVGQLSEVNTEGVEPTYQVSPLENVWREDEVEPNVSADKLLGLQDKAEVYQRQLKVPKVL